MLITGRRVPPIFDAFERLPYTKSAGVPEVPGRARCHGSVIANTMNTACIRVLGHAQSTWPTAGQISCRAHARGSGQAPRTAAAKQHEQLFTCLQPPRVGGRLLLQFSKILVKLALERKHNFVCFRQKESGFCMFLSKRERPTGGKKWTWTRQFARPRPSSTSDEGGSVVPNSRLITAVIWISRTPMGDTGPLGSTQTTTTATAMRQKTRPPRNQTRATWEMEWKARRG